MNGNSSDTWIFQLNGAAAIAGDVYCGDALPANVKWIVTGAFSAGAGSSFCGTIISLRALSLGAQASLFGSMYTPGACIFGADSKQAQFEANNSFSNDEANHEAHYASH